MSWRLVSDENVFRRRLYGLVIIVYLVHIFKLRPWLSCTKLCSVTKLHPQPELKSTITPASVPLAMKRKIITLPVDLSLKQNQTLPHVRHLPLLHPLAA